jgi:hypothetical protein
MDQETEKIILERFKNLPPKIQDAITKSNWQEKIQLIGQKNNLRIDQISELQTNTFLTMLGLQNPNEYQSNIQNELNIGGGLAQTITKDVNDKIFKEVRSLLVAIDEAEKQLEEEQLKLPKQQSPSETLIGKHLGLDRNQIVDEMKDHIEIIDDEDESKDIVSEKLSDISKSVQEDYSIEPEKPSPTLPEENQDNSSSDPYREPVI